jgi:predicted N-acetyltransferase YhbS
VIVLRTIERSDQAEARELILAGLEEHWGFRDQSKNPDLADICGSYAGATFLVACDGERIVGTGALKPVAGANGVAEIVRMSVAAGRRRQGIGRLILRELIQTARNSGVKRVVLETTETWHEVVRFYLAQGFTITHYERGEVHFAFEIGRGDQPEER